MSLPTREEINVHNSLDEAAACEHFYNKTLDEAEAMFRENSAYYQEDLMWMGPKAFQFYLQAAFNYLQSDDSADDADIVFALYNIIEFRSAEEKLFLSGENIGKLIDYVINHYAKFAVDKEIYGDLLGNYQQLQTQGNASRGRAT